MSSATSIKQRSGMGLQGRKARPLNTSETDTTETDAGFRPWHFFVLASLMAATVAVVMSRQSRPEHLILISLTIAAAGFAAAGFYRMLAPLATDDVSIFTEALSERTKATLEREKALTLRSIKELEFDRAMGKVSPKDFDEMVGRLRARAISLMKELDEGEAGYRMLIERELAARLTHRTGVVPTSRAVAPVVVSNDCANCGTSNDADAAFCKRCGTKIERLETESHATR